MRGGRATARDAALVAAVTCLAYLPSLRNDFTNWDDPFYVVDNPAIRSLSWSAVSGLFTSTVLGLYHPLSVLSLAVDYRLFGLHATGYHAVNLGLHLANTLLAYWIILLLSGRRPAAFAGSLLFGVHPLHVESVAWIAERKDVLSAFFYLGALGAYLRALQEGGSRGWRALSPLLLAASLLAKPMGVSFPLAAYLCDYVTGRRIDRRAHLDKLPFLALALASSAISLFPPGPVAQSVLPPRSLPEAFFVGARSLVFLLGKAVFPAGLSAFYPYPDHAGGHLPWAFLLSPLAAAAVGAIALRAARFSRAVPFGILFYAVTLLPVLVRRIGPHFTADRYFYIPSLGLCYLAGLGTAWVLEPGRLPATARRAAAVGLVALVAAFGLATWRRTLVWRDGITLFTHTLEMVPRGSMYLNNLGHALALADNNLGNALAREGRLAEAITRYEEAIQIQPHHVEAHNNLGAALFRAGRTEEALAHFRRALELRPGDENARYNLDYALRALGRAGEAGGSQAPR